MPIYPIAANVQVSATALPLPDGASTEATLSAVNNKLPALVAGKIPVSGTVALDSASLDALENISVTFPATQNVNVTNAWLSISNFPATQPISGTVTANTGLTQPLTDAQLRAASVPISQATAANLNATVVGSGSFTAAQATASNLKAQAQLLNAAGSVVEYATTGSAGTPATDVVSVQGVAGGTVIPVSDKGATGQGTVTSFTSTSSSVLRSSNSNRKLLTVFNEGTGTLFILLGSGTASTTNYSLRILSGDYYELEKYTGEVTAIFASTGTARITEIT